MVDARGSAGRAPGSDNWLLKGLSGVRGNFHAPFFGEGTAARPFSYPTALDSSGLSEV